LTAAGVNDTLYMRLRLARHPDRLDAARPILLQEFLLLALEGHSEALSTMIAMLDDPYRHGRESRHLRKLKNLPLFELRSASRGGEKGGCRIYIFFLANGDAGIVNCEVKQDSAPNRKKLEIALAVLLGYRRGIPVFDEP
jgi:hypothetical protein